MSLEAVEEFLQEAVIMREFNHQNVMSLLGVSVSEEKPCVLLPLLSNGDLKKYLKNQSLVS